MSRVSQLLKVAHPDNGKVVVIDKEATVLNAARVMCRRNVGALPVVEGDDEKLVGIISERDITYKVVAEGIDPAFAKVADFMTPDPEYVTPFTDMMDCLNLMKKRRVRHIPVLEEGKLVGIVSIRDVLLVLVRDQTLLAQQFEAFYYGSR